MENKIKLPKNNPFVGRTDGLIFPGGNYREEEYCTCEEQKKVHYLTDDEKDVDIVTELVITDKVSRADYINQFESEVGILNILKKVARSGDTGLLDQAKPAFADVSNMPETFIEARDMVANAYKGYEDLPDEIKNNLSAEEFSKLTSAGLTAIVNNIVAKATQPKKDVVVEKEKVKEGGNENE